MIDQGRQGGDGNKLRRNRFIRDLKVDILTPNGILILDVLERVFTLRSVQ